MPRRPYIPEQLRHGPFTREQARDAGLTSRQLQGKHFRRLFPSVWAVADHPMTHDDWIRAAELAMPPDAKVSHITRIQRLGLPVGPRFPLHLTVSRDLHLDVPEIFLHRTEVMPPCDEGGVHPAAAFVGCAATERLIDLIQIGDWLLHHDHMTTEELRQLTTRQPWRTGARQAEFAALHLDGRAESRPESELRAVVSFAGLPVPEVNVPVTDGPHARRSDLYLREWRLALEFEGGQHFTDAEQIARDLNRYAEMRRANIEYLQVTREMLNQPRALAMAIHARLVERGYRGDPPVFGSRWKSLFRPIRTPARWTSNLITSS